jgi:hypothetical protein
MKPIKRSVAEMYGTETIFGALLYISATIITNISSSADIFHFSQSDRIIDMNKDQQLIGPMFWIGVVAGVLCPPLILVLLILLFISWAQTVNNNKKN